MFAYVKISNGLYILNELWLVSRGKNRQFMYAGILSGLTTTYEFKIRRSHIPNIQSDSRLKVLTSGACTCVGIPSQLHIYHHNLKN